MLGSIGQKTTGEPKLSGCYDFKSYRSAYKSSSEEDPPELLGVSDFKKSEFGFIESEGARGDIKGVAHLANGKCIGVHVSLTVQNGTRHEG